MADGSERNGAGEGFTLASALDAGAAPEDCREMGEVRAEIDRLDRVLVVLIAERTRYIEAAARIKPDRSGVRVPWRIEDVIAKVLAAAREEGLPHDIAEPVWRELVERSIRYEDVVWRSIRSAESREG